ncbi:MAG: hypothetical protein ACRDXF_09750, partial [Acidimicrobiia bacterium]
PIVGLGQQVDGELLRALARSIAAWDEDQENPGGLARSIGLRTTSGDPDRIWVNALTGMGPEVGYTIDRLWEVDEPPPEVREALRAFLVWWGVQRPAPAEAGAVGPPPPAMAVEAEEDLNDPMYVPIGPPPAPMPEPTALPRSMGSPIQSLMHQLGRAFKAILGLFGGTKETSMPTPAPPSSSGSDVELPSSGAPPVRPHFLDESPIDFSRPEVQEFERIVLDGYGKPELLSRLADLTGIDPASLDMRNRPQTMVRGFLITVSEEGRLRDLARVMGEDTSLGSLRERVIQLTAEGEEPYS